MNQPTGPLGRLDLGLVADAFMLRWKLVLLMVVLVPIVAVGARAVINPKVKLSAQLLIKENRRANPFLGDIMADWPVRNRVPMITAIVESRATLDHVARALKDIDDTTSHAVVEAKIAQLRAMVDVWGEGGGLIRITATGRHPQRVYDVISVLLDKVLLAMVEPQQAALDESVTFLTRQTARLEGEVQALEDKLTTFKMTHAAALPEVHRLNLEAHIKLNADLLDTQSRLVAARARQRLAERRLMRYDPTQQRLRDQLDTAKRALQAARRTYTNIHPRVKSLQAKVRNLDDALTLRRKRHVVLDIGDLEGKANATVDVESKRTSDGTHTDIVIRADDVLTSDLLTYQGASSEVQSLEYKLKLLRERAETSVKDTESFATNEKTLTGLQRDLMGKTKIYTNLLQRLEDARVTRELTRLDAGKQLIVIDKPAGPIPAAILPLWLVLATSPLIGLILAVALVALLELMDPTIRTPAEATTACDAPVLGTLPWMGDAPAAQ